MYISSKRHDDKKSLWQKFASGDKSVFGQLYSHYHKSLTAYCIGRLGNLEHAENVASEVLIKLLQHKGINEIENFEGWLFHVAKNECLTQLSKTERRRQLLNDNYQLKIDNQPDVEAQFSQENIDHLIQSTLDEKDYKIWQLHQQGYDNEEIAEIINSSEKTVANRKSAARAKLKDAFKKLGQWK